MAREPSRLQGILLAIVIASIVIFVADIIAVNIDGDALSWTLAVPVGMLLVPIVGIISFVMWFSERNARTL